MEEQEVGIDELINNIFYSPPKNEKSINLDLDCDDIKQVFQVLVEIFTKGMKIKFGDNAGSVNLDELALEDFNLMKEYFASFGFKLFFDKEDKNTGEKYKSYKEEDMVGELSNEYMGITTANNRYCFYFVF